MTEKLEGRGTDAAKKPLFRDLDAGLDLDELEATEIESLCMKCYNNVML